MPPLPPIEGGVTATGSAYAGDLFVQGHIDGTWFDDTCGIGWRLVTIDREATAIDPGVLRWFESIDGVVAPVSAIDPVYRRWFEEHDVTYALQRPDFHLYGTATGAADASALLTQLHHHLQPAGHTLEGVPL